MADVILSVQNLTKTFAVTVLDRVSLDVRGGEIHALIGANGAGKSTLCRIVAGLLRPTSGSMEIQGQRYEPPNKQAAQAAGIQIVQQELNLIPTLSIAENLMLGRMPHTFGVLRRRRMNQHAKEALHRFGLSHLDPQQLSGSLGVGHQQMVEIAIALDQHCRVLILDEPTAALSDAESSTLFEKLNELRDNGVAIIYISHRLDEITQITDRVTVLRDGVSIGTYPTNELSPDSMVDRMTGDEQHRHRAASHRSFATEQLALRVVGFTCGRTVRNVSFLLHRGERLGVTGLVGAGRTELLRLIFGADRADRGEIFLADKHRPQRFTHPHQAVAAGLAMVTEDRKDNGLLLSQSIRLNTTLASMISRFSRAGLIRSREEQAATVDMCEKLEIRCSGIEQTVATLSGGNQQKVAVAKWLTRQASIFFFDEPTRGIDVAARRKIYRLFDSLAAEGKSLVIVSSDLEELMETCDRIAVLSGGRLVKTFVRDQWSREEIMQAAFSAHVHSS